ncbi:MAG: hypothetical protein H7249_12910 [Chitinophagaceae bacterium]|nr:hypothetical protein [Oligoflexus sp.]
MSIWKISRTTFQVSGTYILLGFLALSSLHLEATARPTPIDWKASPSAENWKEFFKISAEQKAQTWTNLQKEGLVFEAMSWEWKLAWVRSCTLSSTKDCSNIMQNGLFDKALVVRAEAATRLGQRFTNTGHAPAIRLLRTAYAVEQNSRAKEPLFVQYRILQALNEIGGEGRIVGKELARGSESMNTYWSRIASAK